MTGESLKPYITALDTSLAETARKLGLSPQGLDSMLKTKDIKTGLLERLSRVYKKPISYFFDEKETAPTIVEADSHSLAMNMNNSSISIGDFQAIQKENEQLHERVSELKEYIADLKEHIKELKSK